MCAKKFLSTPSVRRATRWSRPRRQRSPISIHALREEGDLLRAKDTIADQIFLSTPSVRRATGAHLVLDDGAVISIHALREEGDGSSSGLESSLSYFYPRPP